MRSLQLTSAGGLIGAAVALLASSCCALPMALVFMGVSTGAVGLLGPLHQIQPILLALAAALVLFGWVIAIRRRSARAYPLLGIATVMLALSLFWQSWDPILQRLVIENLRP